MVQLLPPEAIDSTGSGASPRHARPGPAERASSTLGRAIETCLALAILIPPFLIGGREAYGQLVIAILVLVTFGLWVIRRIGQGPSRIPFRRPEIFLVLAAGALCLASLIPLPAEVVRTLAPGIRRLLPGWEDGSLRDPSGGWHYLSLTPGLSRGGAILFGLYGLLFWITVDTVRTKESARRLLSVLFMTAIGVAAVGFLHYLFWNGKFYGLWQVWWVEPDRHVRAPFTNRNHFAGFLALAAAPGAVAVLQSFRRWKSANYLATAPGSSSRRPHELLVLASALGFLLILAGLVLSQSRGGMIVGLLALVAVSVGSVRSGLAQATSLAAIALVIIGSLVVVVALGHDDPFERSATLLQGNQSVDSLSNQRLRLWKADLHALADFPITGTGVGSHSYVYPLYLEGAHHLTFTHAESGYVQVLVECGLIGGALLLLAIYSIGTWCLRALHAYGQRRDRTGTSVVVAVSVSVLVAISHGLVDFVWYVPAYATALAVLAGLACSLYRNAPSPSADSAKQGPTPSQSRWFVRSAWGFGLAVCCLGTSLLVGRHFVEQARAYHAWSAYLTLLPETDQPRVAPDDSGNSPQRAELLAEVCRSGSADPDHHYRLGLAYLEVFLQRQRQLGGTLSLVETRAILQADRFKGAAEARAWLERLYATDLALLEAAQASFRRSLECCPLYGSAYVHLAELCFLDGVGWADPQPLCRQALLVRPYDPDIHLHVGLEAWIAGDRASAKACWTNACQRQPDICWALLPILADQLPAGQAADFVPLDFDALRWLARRQADLGRPQGQRQVLERAQRAVELDPQRCKSAGSWVALHELHQEAHLEAEAESCLRQAIELAPGELGYLLRLIRLLMEQHRWDEALEEAQTARSLFPQASESHNLLRSILARRVPPAGDQRAKRPAPDQSSRTDPKPP